MRKEQQIKFYNKYINKKYKNHLLLYDNASPHKLLLLRNIIKDSNNHLLYCVHYHPETNPKTNPKTNFKTNPKTNPIEDFLVN